ncbi:glyoxalase/bleomycin resistance protein/dioxygenase [Hyphomonas adhaerens MHS-3]|uniref:Glyoxalase/bleomycin resistance protein/dioxygenase n=1 Tax=Hyphomonas adhaerens MHS-3 TaxID=1280949 RepID=A0A069E743_9PROT|nr:VOC family protein [Hyphomonas adhaerens]KCZ86105.1 glyoxalase/bleomycin resistance protein/dioxygenase [Hyphomonas adhaerens MHS-3]
MTPIIKIEDIAHVRFAAPDLGEMQAFLEDFGLDCSVHNGRLYGRGSDGRPFLHSTEPGDPAFKGLGLRAESMDALEALASAEGAAIHSLDDPGGGSVVRLTDPDGFRVEVIAGQQVTALEGNLADGPHNNASSRQRVRKAVRLSQGPSHIVRLGHAVLNVSDFRVSEEWYKQRFGFLTSDEVELAPGTAMGAFMRCDRGDQPTDHHTLFLAQLPQPVGFLHAAFEVAHLDDLMLGHAHLKSKGCDQAWGVGRHIMGSQVFDYWRDPWGHELEHWTDGDLFTAADPPNKMPFSSLLAVQWGAPHPMVAGESK